MAGGERRLRRPKSRHRKRPDARRAKAIVLKGREPGLRVQSPRELESQPAKDLRPKKGKSLGREG